MGLVPQGGSADHFGEGADSPGTHPAPRAGDGRSPREHRRFAHVGRRHDGDQRCAGPLRRWQTALVSFPKGGAPEGKPSNEVIAVVVDQIAERSRLTDDARALLPKLIEACEPLNDGTIAPLSAAWVAASLALLAREETTAAGFRTLSDEAGRWVIDGW